MEKKTKADKAMARLNDLANLYQHTLSQLEAATDSKIKFDMTHRLNHLRREYVKAQAELVAAKALRCGHTVLNATCPTCREAVR